MYIYTCVGAVGMVFESIYLDSIYLEYHTDCASPPSLHDPIEYNTTWLSQLANWLSQLLSQLAEQIEYHKSNTTGS